jgi:Outer membrane protein beta-barrel domain
VAKHFHKVLLLSAFVLLCPRAKAQDNEEDTLTKAEDSYLHPSLFEGRIVAGTNFCQVYGDTYGGYHKVGLNAGGMVYVHFKPALGASLEMVYTQKGVRSAAVKESYAVGTYFDKYYLNLNYVEMALMLHLDMFFFDYEAGISYAQLLKSAEWAEADVPIYIDPRLAYFNTRDFAYIVGLSRRINEHWCINFHFQYSATTIRPWDRVPPRYSDGSNEYNALASLRLVYKIK